MTNALIEIRRIPLPGKEFITSWGIIHFFQGEFWRPAGHEDQTSKSGGGVEGGGHFDLSKPMEFIAFLTCRRRGLCSDHV